MKKLVMPLVIVGILVLAASVAFGADKQLNCTNPTQRTDNTPLLLSEIGSTRFEAGACNGTAFVDPPLASKTITGGCAATVLPGIPYGTSCYRAFTTTKSGLTSAASAVVQSTVVEAPPMAPIITTITTAFEYQRQADGTMTLVWAGDIAEGVGCGSTWPRDPHFARVSYTDIKFRKSFTYKGGMLLSVCG